MPVNTPMLYEQETEWAPEWLCMKEKRKIYYPYRQPEPDSSHLKQNCSLFTKLSLVPRPNVIVLQFRLVRAYIHMDINLIIFKT